MANVISLYVQHFGRRDKGANKSCFLSPNGPNPVPFISTGKLYSLFHDNIQGCISNDVNPFRQVRQVIRAPSG